MESSELWVVWIPCLFIWHNSACVSDLYMSSNDSLYQVSGYPCISPPNPHYQTPSSCKPTRLLPKSKTNPSFLRDYQETDFQLPEQSVLRHSLQKLHERQRLPTILRRRPAVHPISDQLRLRSPESRQQNVPEIRSRFLADAVVHELPHGRRLHVQNWKGLQ